MDKANKVSDELEAKELMRKQSDKMEAEIQQKKLPLSLKDAEKSSR